MLYPEDIDHLEAKAAYKTLPLLFPEFLFLLLNGFCGLWYNGDHFCKDCINLFLGALKELPSSLIDQLSLLVKYVVVCKHLLTSVKMKSFYTCLRSFELLREHCILNRLVFRDAEG